MHVRFIPLWLCRRGEWQRASRLGRCGGMSGSGVWGSAFLTFRPHRLSTVAIGRSVGNILMDVLEMQYKYTDGFDIRKQGFVNCLESEAEWGVV
jgi:hypothetical protein